MNPRPLSLLVHALSDMLVSRAQRQAGNYRKPKITFQGLKIAVENPKGSVRTGTGPDGHPWAVVMPADYGYLLRTESAHDGDHVDCFVGPDKASRRAFVVHASKPNGDFDEHKVMLGFADQGRAFRAFRAAYHDGGRDRVGGVEAMSIADLKQWLMFSGMAKHSFDNETVFDSPVVFEQAARAHAVKEVLPMSLTGRQAQEQLGADFFRRSFVSSQVEEARILDTVHGGISGILAGTDNPAHVRVEINKVLAATGYQPPAGKAGTIGDLRTLARQNVLIDTNLAAARGMGRAQVANDPDLVDEFPGFELVRGGYRTHPRGDPWYKEGTDGSVGWGERWLDAADESGDDDAARVFSATGRMVALKSSPIWQALGDGAGGREDTLGSDVEPYAWGSAMVREEVERAECESFGLLETGEKAEPAKLAGVNDTFAMAPGVEAEPIKTELLRTLKGTAKLKGGALTIP